MIYLKITRERGPANNLNCKQLFSVLNAIECVRSGTAAPIRTNKLINNLKYWNCWKFENKSPDCFT